jgi:tetratricopeptide (TPR) repeat protein
VSSVAEETGTLDRASARAMGHFALIDHARAAMQRRDWAEALRWWEATRAAFPNLKVAYLSAGAVLRQAGRLDEADQMLEAAVARFPADEVVAAHYASVAALRGDRPQAVGRWQAARLRFPQSPAVYAESLNALLDADLPDEAEALAPAARAVLADATSRGDDRMVLLRLELATAKACLDWEGVRRCAQAIIDRDVTPSARTYVDLAQACWRTDDVDAAGVAAQRALEINPSSRDALTVAVMVATDKGDALFALDCYRRLSELQPASVRWAIKRIELLNWLGRVDEAVRELDVLCERAGGRPGVKLFRKSFGPASAAETDLAWLGDLTGDAHDTFKRLADAAPAPPTWKRPLIVPAPGDEAQFVEMPGAKAAVLVFTGAQDIIAMPLTIFDRHLATLDVSVAYLKDFSRLLFLRGIGQLGDGYDLTLERLKARLDALGVERLFAIGDCDGAFAAIRYGVDLGAEYILAASPPTHFPDAPLPKLEQGRNFKRSRLLESVPPAMTDLKPFLDARDHRSLIEIVYNAEDERERVHAERMIGTPGVSLLALEGNPRHAALHRFVLSADRFDVLLAGRFGLAAPAAGG